ncbi:unnamed protein product [Auanema sp. JU1783]|nr:unnamed protein product [Auanema sp. JU1783]
MDEPFFVQLLAYIMIASGFACFVLLGSGFRAGYGRYDSTVKLEIPAKLAWLLQECPSFLIPTYYFLSCNSYDGRFVLMLFIIHYAQRSIYYPIVVTSSKGSPLHIFFAAVLFCTYNGYMQGSWHALFFKSTNFFSNPLTYIGTAVFFLGMIINIQSDSILRNLRKPGELGYKIPRGGLFEYVSGANYFGEIVEWLGFALVARSLPSVAFAIFTISNIGPRAIQHHRYYLEKFEDYPKNRKAIIPFVY